MNLKDYQKKRDFDLTPEPKGKEQKAWGSQKLVFVVQKHNASHLHFDFRLEFAGVLKSWAIPKGPSLDPKEKRLAIMVEDHPFEYRFFEGIIPPENYGAGKVGIWDKGTYFPVGEGINSQDRLKKGLEKGHMSFVLEGEKLRGEFAMHRIGSDNKKWLLIKKEDKYSSSSVAQFSIKEVSFIKGAKQGKPQTPIKPMLSTLIDKPFNKEDSLYELKWDGYRAISEVFRDGEIKLYSRNNENFKDAYFPIAEALKNIHFDAILDGEIVAINEKGQPDFQLLQQYKKTRDGFLVYYVFDILYFEGFDLTNVPLVQRRELLKKILPRLLNVRTSEYIEGNGERLYKIVKEIGLEGIIAKNKKSKYLQGVRSLNWLKIKLKKRQEAVIGGFTESRGTRRGFGALILGVYEGDKLVYVGHAGGGLDDAGLVELREKLDLLVTDKSPFSQEIKANAPFSWVKPKLVAEIEFSEWTQEGYMRHPIIIGIREDKDPKDVVREIPKQVQYLTTESSEFTNLSKVYFPNDGYLKKDVIEYYKNISSFILPYIKDRPQSLHRFPDGIYGDSFYHKNIEDPIPSWLKTYIVYSESEERDIRYLVCNDVKTLLYIANLGAIEINTWLSRIQNLEKPDYSVLDLDPLDVNFEAVVKVALEAKKILDKLEIEAFIKTSGATGMHIYIPLGARYTYKESKSFAQILAFIINREVPEFSSIERSPERRRGKVYIDYLQNRAGQTMVAHYSLRPRDKAPVSTPISWNELDKNLKPEDFTIKTIFKRLEKYGDIWQGAFDKGIDMQKILSKISLINNELRI